MKEGFFNKIRSVGLACAVLGTGCEAQPTVVPEDVDSECQVPTVSPERFLLDRNLESSEYHLILDSYESLKNARNRLAGMDFISPEGETVSGYQLLTAFLEHVYDQELAPEILEKKINDYFSLDPAENRINRRYFMTVAQSLWVERNGIVPWSLRDYSADEIEALFYHPEVAGSCVPSYPEIVGSDVRPEIYDVPQPEDDATYQTYRLAMNLKQNDQTQTIRQMTRWIKSNFFHAYSAKGENFDWRRYGDGRPTSEAFTVDAGEGYYYPRNLKRWFEERISGCHEPALGLKSMLRSVNIPAFNLRIEGHGVTYLPTLKRFVHGDSLVLRSLIPLDDTFLTSELFNNLPARSTTLSVHDSKYKAEHKDFFTYYGIERRSDKNTPLYMPTIPVDPPKFLGEHITPEDLTVMREQVPEFNLRYSPDGKTIISDDVPIQNLDELSRPGAKIW